MTVLVDDSTIVLTGTVDDGGWFWDDGFSAPDVIRALALVGNDRDVTIRINSGGGIATEGGAIHAALKRHGGRKTIIVEGIAASAASIIVMAGDERIMSPGSVMMTNRQSVTTR
jgi:ATP-dependent protease ClpP protease subunit